MKKIIFFLFALLVSIAGISRERDNLVSNGSFADHFVPAFTGFGFQHMDINILEAKIDGVSLESGDEIAAFDGSVCVGVLVLSAPFTTGVIAASQATGDLPIDGFTDGNAISIKFWDSSASLEFPVVIKNGSGLSYSPLYAGLGSIFVRLSATTVPPPSGHFSTYAGNGVDHMTINIEEAKLCNADLTTGDEIAAFDGDICVGVTRLTGPFTTGFIAASHIQDLFNPDGYTTGHPITFKYWDALNSREIPLVLVDVVSGLGLPDPPVYVLRGETFVRLASEVPAAPTITPGGPLAFCEGGNVTLTSSLGTSYFWSTTETSQSITVSTSGSYTVQVTNGIGCISAASAPAVVAVSSDIVVTGENFNTNKGPNYYGATVGYALSGADAASVVSVKVEILDGDDQVLVTNTSKPGATINIVKQYSCAFPVKFGTYTASSSSTWNFGAWTPAANAGTVPAKAIITVEDANGCKYTAEIASFAASEPSHPTWASLFPDIVLAAENFNTHRGSDFYGATVGYRLSGAQAGTIASVSVKLFATGDVLMMENTSKSADKINNTLQGPQYSCAFPVKFGTYTTSSTWNFGAWTPAATAGIKPAKTVVTLTDLDGYTYSVENTVFSEATATWVSLFPSDIVITGENFNTNKGTDYYGATTGWALSGTEVANVASVSVKLYNSSDVLMVENTSKSADKVNTAKQYSCAFPVKFGTYSTSSTWNFGAWTPAATAGVAPAKAVITVTDIYGFTFEAELTSFSEATATWVSLFPSDIVITGENFNTNKGTDYYGATTGWALSGTGVANVASVSVKLYNSSDVLMVENTSKSADKVNTAKQYSCAFPVSFGTYSSSSTWNFGAWTPAASAGVAPAKAVITVTDVNGFTYEAELTSFSEATATWVSLFPSDIVITGENFNTNKGTDYYGVTTGWALSGTGVANVASVSVKLYNSSDALMVENTSKSADKVNSAKQYSCAFPVMFGTYNTSSTWNFGAWTPAATAGVAPAKAVITVTDIYGFTFEAELTSLSEATATWVSLFPSDIVITGENFNTNRGADYYGVTTGWALSGTGVGNVASVSVKLYNSSDVLMVENTSKSADKVNTAKQYSCAFPVKFGTYSTSSTWNFGAWTPAATPGVAPAKAVITITDVNGFTYEAELTSLSEATATWVSLFISNIVITGENFNTNKGADYYGVTTGWALSGADVANVASVSVKLYNSSDVLMVENTSKSADKVNTAKQYSCAFPVMFGTYNTSSTWNFGAWTPAATAGVAPAKAVITVTDINGFTYSAELTSLSEATATWVSLFPSDIVITGENFNTNKGLDYYGVTTGWALSGTGVANVASVSVKLYDSSDVLMVENTSKSADKVNTSKQYSCAFPVMFGTYNTSSTWNFGAWTPAATAGIAPAKAVITVTDINGFTYEAELTSLSEATATWVSLFPSDIVLTGENFNTNKGTDYYGVTTGWALSGTGVANVASVSVKLYNSSDVLMVENTSKSADKVNTAKQYSCAFPVKFGTYSTSSTWNFGAWTPAATAGIAPAKAIITVTDVNGFTYEAELTSLSEATATWVSLFPSDIVITGENFNTNKGTDYYGVTTGWALSGADVANVASVSVKLYNSLDVEMVENTSKSADKVNTAKQYSCAFPVMFGTYNTSSTWNFGAWTPAATAGVAPAKAVITVTDVNGFTYQAVLTPLSEATATWVSLFGQLNIRVFLEGPYLASTGAMDLALNAGDLLDHDQPYNVTPWNYEGTENADPIPAGVVDWVLVELRVAATPGEAVPATKLAGWPKALFLKADGMIVGLDGTSLPEMTGSAAITGNLYIVIRHRNHLAIMSSTGATPVPGGYSYDFTTGVDKVYGGANGCKMVGIGSSFDPMAAMVAGDIDRDGKVYPSDYLLWANEFGLMGYVPADLDLDGKVYPSDYKVWANNFGKLFDSSLKSNLVQPKYYSSVPK